MVQPVEQYFLYGSYQASKGNLRFEGRNIFKWRSLNIMCWLFIKIVTAIGAGGRYMEVD